MHSSCRDPIKADRQRIDDMLQRSLMLVTALVPAIGYDKAASIARAAHTNGTTLRQETLLTGLLSAAEFDHLVQPKNMLGRN